MDKVKFNNTDANIYLSTFYFSAQSQYNSTFRNYKICSIEGDFLSPWSIRKKFT